MFELPLSAHFAIAVGLSAGIALFTMAVLRREVGLPVFVSAMVVPVVVGVGFTLAVAIKQFLTVSLLESLGLLGAVLFALTVLYELNYSSVVRT